MNDRDDQHEAAHHMSLLEEEFKERERQQWHDFVEQRNRMTTPEVQPDETPARPNL